MPIWKSRMFSLIIALLVIFSTMYVESEVLHETVQDAMTNQQMSSFQTAEVSIQDARVCSVSMLEANVFTKLIRFSNQQYKQKGELRQPLLLLMILSFLIAQGKFFSSLAEIAIDNLCLDELVTYYLHKSDGKKEIIS